MKIINISAESRESRIDDYPVAVFWIDNDPIISEQRYKWENFFQTFGNSVEELDCDALLVPFEDRYIKASANIPHCGTLSNEFHEGTVEFDFPSDQNPDPSVVGKPHIDEDQEQISMLLKVSDYETYSELVSVACKVFENACTSYFSQPEDQTKPLKQLVLETVEALLELCKPYCVPVNTVIFTLDEFSTEDVLKSLVELSAEGSVDFISDRIYLPPTEVSYNDDLQDQCSSEDGEVIL